MLVVVVAVVILTFYISSWYKTIKSYYESNSVIPEVVSSIDGESLSNYLLDNPKIILYLASSSDVDVKSFEKKFKKYIVDNNLNDDILYLDTLELTQDEVDKLILSHTKSTLKRFNSIAVPNLICFEDGRVVDILYTKKKHINKDDMINFLERNDVLSND